MVIATAQHFGQAVLAATTLGELNNLLHAITREMGFQYFALSHHVDVPRAPQPVLRLHNYPPEWEAYYDAERFGPSDPVHRASHLTSAGFCWSMLSQLLSLTNRDEDFLARSRKIGLIDGITIPAHLPGEAAGSCSFAVSWGNSPRPEWLPVLQFVGTTAFESARRLVGMRRAQVDRPRLSDRQRDCLYWAAQGKSDWAIAKILGISHETAIQHLKEARGRYGVGNRTQLAIHAIFDGALSFTDALRR